MKYLSLFLLALLVLPSASLAYLKTGSEEFTVDGKTAVFTLDYAFGHEKQVLEMPLRAHRGDGEEDKKNTADLTLHYEVLDTDGNPGKGTAYAVILSDAKVVDGTYELKKDFRYPFRLLVLYTRTEEEKGNEFRVQVNHLPFAFKGVQNLSLNTSELRYYTTDPLQLGGMGVILRGTTTGK